MLLNSMDADGTTAGFDLELIEAVRRIVDVPVIASGGAGALEHFYEVFSATPAAAALAASLFHYQELRIGEVKSYLKKKGVNVRWP